MDLNGIIQKLEDERAKLGQVIASLKQLRKSAAVAGAAVAGAAGKKKKPRARAGRKTSGRS